PHHGYGGFGEALPYTRNLQFRQRGADARRDQGACALGAGENAFASMNSLSDCFQPDSLLSTWWTIESELDACSMDVTTQSTLQATRGDPAKVQSFELRVKRKGVFSGR